MSIYHKHHIVPRHMGGTDDPSNLVELTIEEHAEAHRKLFEEHGRWQDEVAWKGLSGMICREDIIKEIISNSNTSRPVSQKTRDKISSNKKQFFEENPPNFIGRKHSLESKSKMRSKAVTRTGEKNSQFGTSWIHNPETGQNSKIKKNTKLPVGWVIGRRT